MYGLLTWHTDVGVCHTRVRSPCRGAGMFVDRMERVEESVCRGIQAGPVQSPQRDTAQGCREAVAGWRGPESSDLR